MNLNDISTQLLFTTVPIWTEKAKGGSSTGTAFIYNVPVPNVANRSIPFLVTNLHVVADAKRAVIEMVEKAGELPSPDKRVHIEIDAASLERHRDENLDLAAVPLGPVMTQMVGAGRSVFFRSLGPELIPGEAALFDLAAMEEIVFIGYPSGLRDQKNGTPLIRRGITATPVWNDFEGKPVFLVDAGVFPGSSGSPVFILNQGSFGTREGITIGNRLLFLGVMTETIVRPAKTGDTYLGIGKAVRSTAVQSFLERIARPMMASAQV